MLFGMVTIYKYNLWKGFLDKSRMEHTGQDFLEDRDSAAVKHLSQKTCPQSVLTIELLTSSTIVLRDSMQIGQEKSLFLFDSDAFSRSCTSHTISQSEFLRSWWASNSITGSPIIWKRSIIKSELSKVQ